jgi:flagellar motor switch protein FliG
MKAFCLNAPLVLALAFLLIQPVATQAEEEQPLTQLQSSQQYEVPVKKDELEEARFKNEMEARLARDIQSYLGNDQFIIQVEAVLQKTRTVVKENNGQSPASALPQAPQPTATTTEVRPPQVRTLDAEALEELPGLPVSELPLLRENQQEIAALQDIVAKLEFDRQQALQYADQLKREAQKKIKTIKEKTLGYRNSIKKMTITLVVDRDLEDEQVEFLRNLITRKSQLNELRGDTLAIVRTDFNRIEEKQAATAPQPVKDFLSEYASWIWSLIILTFLLLSALLLIWFYRKMSGTGAAHTPSQKLHGTDHDAAGVSMPTVMPLSGNGDDMQQVRQKLNETRQELVSVGLAKPQLFQRLVNDSLNGQRDVEVAAMLEVMGGNLLKSLMPTMDARQWQHINEFHTQMEWSPDLILTSLIDFHQRLVLAIDNETPQDSKPFSFLEKLNDSQVIYLVKDEDVRIKALVISQLEPQRAADVIQRLKEKDQAAVAFELGQFETLPLAAFKDVADRLAKQSLTVPTFENVTADGLSVLIRMLDSMNTTDETRLLKTLKSEKPETYYRLRQVYFTFADLVRTPERVIANELREINRDVMATSLCHCSTEFKRHVLSALPGKLRTAVIAELKIQESEATLDQVEAARQQVVTIMRNLLKEGRFSMDELAPIAPSSASESGSNPTDDNGSSGKVVNG